MNESDPPPFRVAGRPTVPFPQVQPEQGMLTVSQALEQAIAHFNAGHMREADILCTGVLEAEPGNHHALNLMGNIALTVSKAKIALGYFEKVRKVNPGESAYHFNSGLALAALGQPKKAEKFYRQALELKPDYGEAADNLGLLLANRGRSEEAVELHRKAAGLLPSACGPSINLAGALESLGRLDEALETLEEAKARHPDVPETHIALARLFSVLGRTDEAEERLQAAIGLAPGDGRPYNQLGLLMSARGEAEEAVRMLRKAVDRAPEKPDILISLGFCLYNAAAYGEAMTVLRQALALDPDNGLAWTLWSECLFQTDTVTIDERLFEELETYLSRGDAEPKNVSNTVQDLLGRDNALTSLRLMADTGDISAIVSELASGKGFKALDRPLLTRFILCSRVSNVALERLLTGARRAFLRLHETGRLGKVVAAHNGLRFLTALAGQCFINEYVFDLRDGEAVSVRNLEKDVSLRIEAGTVPDPAEIALLACYLPLHRVSGGERLAAIGKLTRCPFVGGVLRQQIDEPLAEHQIRKEIPRLSKIDDAVSLAVRDQYEQNPYPRWRNIIFVQPHSFRTVIRANLPGIRDRNMAWPKNPRILVAGCGSGEQPLRTALTYEGASVVGVDLSLSSLAYAERMRRDIGVGNLEFAQADLLEIGEWKDRFDIVICSGVLHHLEDPLRGWRILIDLLKPDGFLLIGLYSKTARRAVVDARSFIADKGYEPTPEDIRRCRQDLLALPEDHPTKQVTRFGDFNGISTCRDLLFHVQEHRFSIPEIADALRELDLEFLGFFLISDKTNAEYRARFPEDPTMTDLACWEQYERDNPNAFRGMYEFWVSKLP